MRLLPNKVKGVNKFTLQYLYTPTRFTWVYERPDDTANNLVFLNPGQMLAVTPGGRYTTADATDNARY